MCNHLIWKRTINKTIRALAMRRGLSFRTHAMMRDEPPDLPHWRLPLMPVTNDRRFAPRKQKEQLDKSSSHYLFVSLFYAVILITERLLSSNPLPFNVSNFDKLRSAQKIVSLKSGYMMVILEMVRCHRKENDLLINESACIINNNKIWTIIII